MPVDQQTTIQVFTPTSIVTTRDGLSRVLLVVGGLGVVGSVAVVLIVDALLMRRVRRREAKADGEDELKLDGARA